MVFKLKLLVRLFVVEKAARRSSEFKKRGWNVQG